MCLNRFFKNAGKQAEEVVAKAANKSPVDFTGGVLAEINRRAAQGGTPPAESAYNPPSRWRLLFSGKK
jgi:hypothetical protein